MTSMARITSPGWSPGAIKIGSSPGISSQPSRNLITAAARPMVISATRNLAKIWKPLIIFSGMNFSPSATSTATMITGIIFIRISAKVNATGWPLISTPEYIATRPPAIQPMGIVTMPASTPSASQRRSAGSIMPSATGMENTMVGPIMEPRIRPEYIQAATSPPASSLARKKPPISHASSVPANIDGLAPSISYSGIITGPSRWASTGARAVIPTIARPSAPIAINPSSN